MRNAHQGALRPRSLDRGRCREASREQAIKEEEDEVALGSVHLAPDQDRDAGRCRLERLVRAIERFVVGDR